MILLRTSPVPAEPAHHSRLPVCPLLDDRSADCPDDALPEDAVGEAARRSPGRHGPALAKNVRLTRLRAYYAAVCLTVCLGIAAATMGNPSILAHRQVRPRAQAGSDIVRVTLPSGMRVVIKPDAAAPVVAMRAVWAGGLRLELPEQSGITRFLAALFTRGCGSLGSHAMAAQVERLGGSLEGLAGRNSFGLRAEWPAQSWAAGLDLMASCIRAPHWHETEIAREKRRVASELARRATWPSAVAFRLFARTLYQHHPYGQDPLGTSETVAALSRAALDRHYRERFPASEMTLAIVGAVDPDDVLGQVRQVFGHGAAGGGQASPGGREPARAQGAARLVRFGGRPARLREVYGYLQGQQAYVMIGFPGVTIAHADRFALEVLTTILGGPSGPLERALQRGQALAYRVGAASVPGVDTGYVVAYAACKPHALGAAVAALREQLALVARMAVDAGELERAKRALLASHERSLGQPAAVAAGLAFHEAHGLGHAEYLRYPAAIGAVTAADVQRVAVAYLAWEAAVTATIMPPASSPEAEKRARGVKRRIPRGTRQRKP